MKRFITLFVALFIAAGTLAPTTSPHQGVPLNSIGVAERSRIETFTTNGLWIGPGRFHHNGSTEQILSIVSDIEFILDSAALTQTLIGAATGNILSDLLITGGVGVAFDGDTTKTAAQAAQKASATTAYIGKDWGSRSVTLTGIVITSSSDQGFSSVATPNITITIRGADTLPTDFAADGDLLHTFGPTADSNGLVFSELAAITESTAYKFHWAYILSASSGSISTAEVQMYADVAGSNPSSSVIGTSRHQYIYLDDSAIVTNGTTTVTASEIVNKTAAPTYNAAKGGYYNGQDRCIGWAYASASSGVISETKMFTGDEIWVRARTSIASGLDKTIYTPQDVSAIIPTTIADMALFGATSAAASTYVHLSSDGTNAKSVFKASNSPVAIGSTHELYEAISASPIFIPLAGDNIFYMVSTDSIILYLRAFRFKQGF